MIDRIVLHVSRDNPTLLWLFSTVSMTDPRIHVCQDEDKMKEALTPKAILVNCGAVPVGNPEIDICIGTNADWSHPNKDVVTKIWDTFAGNGYRVVFNGPCSGSFAPRMPFRCPSVSIAVNSGVYLDGAGDLDLEKAEALKVALSRIYRGVLDCHVLSVAEANLAVFLENRERILSDRRMSSAWMGNHRFNGGRSSLGAWLFAMETHPELFRVGDYVCVSFAGSPLSGATIRSLVHPGSGRKKYTRGGGGFGSMTRALIDGNRLYPCDENAALPLSVIAEILSGG